MLPSSKALLTHTARTAQLSSLRRAQTGRLFSSAAMSPRTVDIDIVSDTVCPWCYVGKLRLEQALSSFSPQDVSFNVRWHPYQLNPTAPEQGEDKLTMYRQKFGPQVDSIIPRMTQTFAELGKKYSIGGLTGNTLNSHRLIHWAGVKFGAESQNKLVEQLFEAYFCNEQYINDRQVLLDCVGRAGLDTAAATAVLDDPNVYREDVLTAITRARRQGVTGVPNFTIDKRYQVSGAQPPEQFVYVLKEVLKQQAKEPTGAEGQACAVGGECA